MQPFTEPPQIRMSTDWSGFTAHCCSTLGRRALALSTSRNTDINVSHEGELKAEPHRGPSVSWHCCFLLNNFFFQGAQRNLRSFLESLPNIQEGAQELRLPSQRIDRKTGKGRAALFGMALRLKVLSSSASLSISPPHFPAMAMAGGVQMERNLKTDQKSYERCV